RFTKLARGSAMAPWMILAESRDRRVFNEVLFSSFEGMSEDRLVSLAEEAFDKVIKPALYKGAKDLVKSSRDSGHDVVLVSGALDFLMQLLADHLGATGIIANRLEIKDRFA